MVIIGRRYSKSTFIAYKRVRSEIAKQSSILGSKIKQLSWEVFGFNSFQIHVEMNIQKHSSSHCALVFESHAMITTLLAPVLIIFICRASDIIFAEHNEDHVFRNHYILVVVDTMSSSDNPFWRNKRTSTTMAPSSAWNLTRCHELALITRLFTGVLPHGYREFMKGFQQDQNINGEIWFHTNSNFKLLYVAPGRKKISLLTKMVKKKLAEFLPPFGQIMGL